MYAPYVSRTLRAVVLAVVGLLWFGQPAQSQDSPALPSEVIGTFKNPILPVGPDPWIVTYNGFFYYTNSTGRNLTLWKTRDISDLAHAEKKVVWTPPEAGPYSKEIWAPELHRMQGKWYIYFAADHGTNESHRIYVIENAADDPLEGIWTFDGKVSDASDKWAIDATVFESRGKDYMLWSGWKGDHDGEQRIYIALLKTPSQIGSKRVEISYPQYVWEHVGDTLDRPAIPHVDVNEGPEILEHGDDIFLVYSASGCWTDYYSLGVVRASAGSNLLKPSSWKKYDHSFFQEDRAAKVFGPGHNGFFKSLDGKEDWIIYHANSESGDGCGDKRSPRIQPFTWNTDGSPNFGKPIATEIPIQKPSH